MKLLEFTKRFPDEESCIRHLKEQREKAGVVCSHCGGTPSEMGQVQQVLGMQQMRSSHHAALRHCDARFKASSDVLVHCYSSDDFHQEDLLGS